MPHPYNAPPEADALRPLAQSTTHAHFPAALVRLLLAWLAAIFQAVPTCRTPRRPGKDWLLSMTADTTEDPDSDWDPYVLRRLFRVRARLGWLMRCDRAEGMALSGLRALAPCPTGTARGPPQRNHARNHPESAAETPRPAAMTHARSAARTFPSERPLHPVRLTPAPSRARPSSP